MKRRNICTSFSIILYVLCILYITLISREPLLSRSVNVDVIISFRKWFYNLNGGGLLLNIVLFIPLGYMLADMYLQRPFSRSIFVCFLVSLFVEVAQYVTKLGTADITDIVANSFGGAIGSWLNIFFVKVFPDKIRKPFMPVLLALGILGCWQMSRLLLEPEAGINDFWFSVDEIHEGGFSGSCYFYEGDTPEYKLYVGKRALGLFNGREYTVLEDLNEKAFEVKIKFKGFRSKTGTGVFLSNKGISYVPAEVPNPDGVRDELLEGAVLKSYSSEFDTYVYEIEGNLIWLIREDSISPDTEIIYHVHTNEPALLPEKRVKYGFDNLGFSMNDSDGQEGPYLYFKRAIPVGYNITSIRVGYNTINGIIWSDYFRPSR